MITYLRHLAEYTEELLDNIFYVENLPPVYSEGATTFTGDDLVEFPSLPIPPAPTFKGYTHGHYLPHTTSKTTSTHTNVNTATGDSSETTTTSTHTPVNISTTTKAPSDNLNSTTSNTTSFTQQIELLGPQEDNLKPSHVKALNDKRNADIQALRDKGLCVPYDDNKETGEKLAGKFYDYQKKIPTTTKQIDFPKNVNVQFHIGLLNVTDVKDTEYLSGVHMHMALYIIQDNQTILWGFLTSQNDDKTIKLSDTQPFSTLELNTAAIVESSNTPPKPKGQYLRVLDIPLLVFQKAIETLPRDIDGELPHDPLRTNQQIADAYIQQENVNQRLTHTFETKVIPKFIAPIEVYDGKGVTWGNIDQVLHDHNQAIEKQANKHFLKYKSKVNSSPQKEIDEWFTDKEKKLDKVVYTRLMEKINEHHAKKS